LEFTSSASAISPFTNVTSAEDSASDRLGHVHSIKKKREIDSEDFIDA
jgi:hypothetical protein